MLRIKKLDIYVLKAFVPIFTGSFFICLFVFMMQMTWRYVEELVGKGLTVDILAEFFWYMALLLVPMSLPLAVLLAMLITFGNLGEKYELLAMKAAGVPLVRIMAPLFVLALGTAGMSFYFQNTISAEAQIKIRQLLISMKQASPVIDIPEGVFYNEIPNINLYVERKVPETGMLYRLIIYKTDQGIENAQIVLADSGKLEMTDDKLYLRLQLWNGEQFENLQASNALTQQVSVPYDRETFVYKQIYISFDANFSLMDQAMLSSSPNSKSMRGLELAVDSVRAVLDSLGQGYYKMAQAVHMKGQVQAETVTDTLRVAKKAVQSVDKGSLDSAMAKLSPEKRLEVLRAALQTTMSIQNDWDWRKMATEDSKSFIRRYWVEWHNKLALSLSCIIFFFVGGALGAIIRKGGLGMPTVISVIIFIFYYIFNTSGMKMARDGKWEIWYGMWISTFIFAPLGAFLTYKANKDSVVFNIDVYLNIIRRFIGLRTPRHLFRKEVIIEAPDYEDALRKLQHIGRVSKSYMARHKLYRFPNYITTFFRHKEDADINALSAELESLVLQLSYSDSHDVVNLLNTYPTLYAQAHVSPFHKKWLNVTAGIIFPVGLLLSVRMWRFRLRLMRDLRQVITTSGQLTQYINTRLIKTSDETLQ